MDYAAASHMQAGRKNNAKSMYGISLEASLIVSGYSPQHYQGFIQDFFAVGGRLFGILSDAKQVVCEADPSRGSGGTPREK